MKKLYILLFSILISGLSFGQDMIITGAFDGPLTGGSPKAVEIYVINDIADLSTYGIGSANNGGGTDGEELSFSGSATAGDFIYVAYEAAAGDFNTYFGFAPDFTDPTAVNVNGDDALELFYNGAVIDTFGDINTDGTGTAWDYLDGWAYRNNSTGPDGTSFVLSNWSFSGINATDGCTDNTTCSSVFPIGTFTYSGTPCGTALGTATFTCAATTTANTDGVTVNIPYTGSDATITSVTTTSGGTVGGDDPATNTDGTITITGLTEGSDWDITLNGGNCDGITVSGTVSAAECLPTACTDLTGVSNQFDIVQITANDETDNWSLSSGEYYINGYCSGCTNATTDSWLVFGPIDMSSAINTELVFNSVEGYSGSDLVVFYTESYSGAPDTTSWTTAQTITSGSDGYYNIGIPSTGSSVYLGIQYVDGDGTYSSWTLSNAGIYADSCPTLSASKYEIEGFAMYPNPTSLGYVMLSSKTNAKMNVAVFDILGKQVLNETVSNKLNVSSLTSGVYIMKVSQENAVSTRKLVID